MYRKIIKTINAEDWRRKEFNAEVLTACVHVLLYQVSDDDFFPTKRLRLGWKFRFDTVLVVVAYTAV